MKQSPPALAPDTLSSGASNLVATPNPEVDAFEACGVVKHARYESAWGSHDVKIDTSHFSKLGTKSKTYFLSKLTIACQGQDSIYTKPELLSHFPRLMDALKFSINATLKRNHKGNIVTAISQVIRDSQRIFSWMMQRGVYHLGDFTPQHCQDLVVALSEAPWSRLLRQNRRLIELYFLALRDPSVSELFVSQSHAKIFPLNIGVLEEMLGIPISSQTIPNSFRRRIAKLVGDRRNTLAYCRKEIPVYAEIIHTMQQLNDFSLLPAEFDCMRFFPFASINSEAGSIFKAQPQQTPNLSPKDCFALFRESLKWIYDYAPAILQIANEGRFILENHSGSAQLTDRRVSSAMIARYRALSATQKLPYAELTGNHKGMQSWRGITETLFVACGIVIAINHARRANEIFGENVPYGLYLGCLQEVSKFPIEYRIDFYVEKGIQDYREFPANILAADSIRLLEEIYQVFRPLGVPPITAKSPPARDDKLFRLRRMTLSGFQGGFEGFSFRTSMNELFRLAGVDAKKFDGTQTPFRRMFTTLFLRRYDCPELSAMQNHLGHLDPGTTIPYQADLYPRASGESIRELHGQSAPEIDAMLKAIDKGRTDYLVELMEGLMSGKSTGGIFPKMVIKLAKRLGASADFRKLTTERRSGVLATSLQRRGYAPNVIAHVVCMAEQPRHTLQSAKCYSDGRLHRENASSELCNGCVHSFSNENYLSTIEKDRDAAHGNGKNELLPPSVRAANVARAERLSALLASERSIAAVNRQVIISLVNSWNQQVVDRDA